MERNSEIEALLPDPSFENKKGSFIAYWSDFVEKLEFAGNEVPFRPLILRMMKYLKTNK